MFVDDWLFLGQDDIGREFVVLCIPPLVSICCFYSLGARSKSDSGASNWKLFLTSLVATCLMYMPFITGLSICILRTADKLWPSDIDLLAIYVMLLTPIVSGTVVAQSLRLPNARLVKLNDETFLARVRQLAERMRISPPEVRLLRSATAAQTTNGYVAGLPCPVVIVTDGATTRLDCEERDAVVCHELAHIANGTLWYLLFLMPFVTTIAVVASFCGLTTGFLLVPVLYFGIHRLISRTQELDCDLRAARLIGFPKTATMLVKIHRLGLHDELKQSVRKWIYAIESHPPLSTRLANLRTHAPHEDRERIPESGEDESGPTWGVFWAWATAVAVACALGTSESWWARGVSAGILLLIAVLPSCVMRLAVKNSNASSTSKRRNRRWIIGVAVALAVSIAVVLFLGIYELPLAIGFSILAMVLSERNQSVKQLQEAWQCQDFRRVITLAQKRKKSVARDANCRHMVAMSYAVLGDRKRGIVEFQELIADHPNAINSMIALVALFLEEGTPDQALSVADILFERFPNTPVPDLVASRILRKLNRLEESWMHIERAIELNSTEGAFYAAAAGVATDLGNYDKARELLKIASERSPGSPQELVEEARLALRTQSHEETIPKLQRAIAALDGNPLLLRAAEATALREELAKLR